MTTLATIEEDYKSAFSSESFYSTFHECSYDDSNKYYLVSNATRCFNFDKIKNSIAKNLTSADSLFFSYCMNCCLFVEFKNQSMRNASLNVGQSAADSLSIHCTFLEKNKHLTKDVNNIFAVVLSYEKNASNISTNDIISSLIRRSGLDDNGSWYFNDAKTICFEKFKRDNPNLVDYYYRDIVLVLSNQFDSFINSFIDG